MKLISKQNGGVVIVSEEFGEHLLKTGQWSRPASPKKSAPKRKAVAEEK